MQSPKQTPSVRSFSIRPCSYRYFDRFEVKLHLTILKVQNLVHFLIVTVSTKRGIKIRNIQVESPHSRESLQQDLFLLSQQTIPIDYQSHNAINILWRELPMSPRSSNCEKYADINFDVQSNIFCCHKVKQMTFIFLNLSLSHKHEKSIQSNIYLGHVLDKK